MNKLIYSTVCAITLLLFSFTVQAQEYYEFRKSEQDNRGLSLTPIAGITVKPGGGSALAGVLKANYTFGKYISAGVAYAFLTQPSEDFGYISRLYYPEHSIYFTVGGMYDFNNRFSADATAGLGYILAGANGLSTYFDVGIGYKVSPAITIKPMFFSIQSYPAVGIGCQIKL